MNDEKKNKKSDSIEIIQNVIVVYINGEKELFEAICKKENKIFTGRIINRTFIEGGFIPNQNIESDFSFFFSLFI